MHAPTAAIALALSSLPALAAASKDWSLTFNWKANCGGDSYTDKGKVSMDCTNIYLRNGVGDVSTKFQTDIDAGYCKVYLYNGQYCGGAVQTFTAYSTDGNGSGKGSVCLTGTSVQSYKVSCTV
ncbi:hypothetical protein F4859DRAFT_519407 [Xylaria cf. heliscus]|nr:hypothetical protein F4859DRAFT_519407 [Xylaria cf. heliscus]